MRHFSQFKFFSACVLITIVPLIFLFSNESPFSVSELNFEETLKENIDLMKYPIESSGMDIVIICANNPALVQFWEQRLQQTRKYLLHPKAIVICVEEDWAKEGAGNGLGTLYAYQKAILKAKEQFGIDILQCQLGGSAVAMYHTAGFGKRLAPLTISEFGIKSAVKLPGLIRPISAEDPEPLLITLLEATIKQSGVYGKSRKGRLSVFWSDQVFIPSNSCFYQPDSHIDILIKMIPFPTEERWKEQHLENYGLIAWNTSTQAKLFDKCSYTAFYEILAAHDEISQNRLAISMGTFSLSTEMMVALLDEFKDELLEKKVLFDSDPYFWMPLTLDYETYSYTMQARKVSLEVIKNHYDRMQSFKNKFIHQYPEKILFSGVDIGKESYWWDYGTVESYYKNNMLMVGNTLEGELMRRFFNIDHEEKNQSTLVKDQNSILINCDIAQGNIKNSIVIGVTAESLDIRNSLMIGCRVQSFKSEKALAYHLNQDGSIILDPYMVRADAFAPTLEKYLKMMTSIDSDGKVNWRNKLLHNDYSWEDATDLVSNKN
jgi:ADP-glucose pyrophosphorylase